MAYRNLLLHPSSRQRNLHAFSQLKDYRPKQLEDFRHSGGIFSATLHHFGL